MEKTMDKIVASGKSKRICLSRALRSTAVLRIHGITVTLGVELKNNVKQCMVAEIYSGKSIQRRC